MLPTLDTQEERMTLESIVNDDMIQEVAEMIAYSGLFGEPIDMQAKHAEEERIAVEKASKPKKKRKVNPNRKLKGKRITAKHLSSLDFWVKYGKDAYILATDDDEFTDAQPTWGNYKQTKDFLMNEWADKKEFNRTEIARALTEKFPEQSSYNANSLFRLEYGAWSAGCYYEDDTLATKPIFKRLGRGTFENIFYAGA